MKDWQKLEPAYLDVDSHTKDVISGHEIWMNDLYQVNVRRHVQSPGAPMFTWLSIKRIDKQPIHDWRHFQWIKNQLVGEQNAGVEMYPKESELVDGSNQYHLWVLEDSDLNFPFGFHDGRIVSETALENGKQRAFPNNMKPFDLDEQELKFRERIKEYNELYNTNFKVKE